ncbi:conserved hypothetical protein [Streptomyces sviceus ATCC 29083]|uniref:Uncharacterized protein n=1 Tax=Streptomyces sviceus (strain ATCC 29083 / DSM 924 / JCM 4929 / NBRC 13980 / NCIMB 11184 / NRRL 5439 / UC 5370) TaxID=463191 RepID=B5I5V5_STRX2|nr:conserved hypothetical protein [Streptomyces sviceus ATCC 29083]
MPFPGGPREGVCPGSIGSPKVSRLDRRVSGVRPFLVARGRGCALPRPAVSRPDGSVSGSVPFPGVRQQGGVPRPPPAQPRHCQYYGAPPRMLEFPRD